MDDNFINGASDINITWKSGLNKKVAEEILAIAVREKLSVNELYCTFCEVMEVVKENNPITITNLKKEYNS